MKLGFRISFLEYFLTFSDADVNAVPDFWYRKWHSYWYLTSTKCPHFGSFCSQTMTQICSYPSTCLYLDWIAQWNHTLKASFSSWAYFLVCVSVFWMYSCALFRSVCTRPACQHDCKKERLSFAVRTNSCRFFAADSGSLSFRLE